MLGSITGSFKAGMRTELEKKPWDPGFDINVAAWFDASDANSYTISSGTNIGTLSDKAGNFTMSDYGTPQRAYNALNMMPAFYWNGNEDYTSDNYGPVADNGNHWSIGLVRWENVNNNRDSFWSFDASDQAKRDPSDINNTRTYALSAGYPYNRWYGEIDYDGANTISAGNAKNSFNETGIGQQIGRYTFAMVAIVFNKSQNEIYGRINGTIRTPVHPYSNNIAPLSQLRLMRNRGSVRLQGYIAEYFHVADLPGTGGTDISDLQKAEGYLAHKWGMDGSLPNNHPYKNSAP